jgi:1-acyl-sn-glycerol-3-phosphate acyltransferase
MRDPEMNWIWTVGAPLVRLIMSVVFRVRVEGIEHVPRKGAVIVAPNHVSVLDGPVVSVVTGTHGRRATRNLIAAENFKGAIGWILRQARQVSIRRGTGDFGALDEAITAARGGSCVGIFPEGRVSDDPGQGPQRIRSGLTRIAIPSGAPVVPVGIWGTQDVWGRTGFVRGSLLRRHTMAVVYGEAVVPHPDEAPEAFRRRYGRGLETVVARAGSLAGDPS